MLCKSNLEVSFPEAFVTHLPRVFSDHCSILLELIRPHPAADEKPFRFHTMWIHHPEFPEVVKKAWEPNLGLHSAIRNSIDRAKQWNKDVFGNLFARKKKEPGLMVLRKPCPTDLITSSLNLSVVSLMNTILL